MTYPQYQVNLGYDPLLAGVNSPVDYVAQLDNQIQQLNIAKNQIQSQLNNPAQTNQQHFTEQKINLWDEIDKEVSSLNNDQQAILAKDEVYNKLSGELQMLIQEELINSVKDKVANSPQISGGNLFVKIGYRHCFYNGRIDNIIYLSYY